MLWRKGDSSIRPYKRNHTWSCVGIGENNPEDVTLTWYFEGWVRWDRIGALGTEGTPATGGSRNWRGVGEGSLVRNESTALPLQRGKWLGGRYSTQTLENRQEIISLEWGRNDNIRPRTEVGVRRRLTRHVWRPNGQSSVMNYSWGQEKEPRATASFLAWTMCWVVVHLGAQEDWSCLGAC
jgi:hypothetical protein